MQILHGDEAEIFSVRLHSLAGFPRTYCLYAGGAVQVGPPPPGLTT